MIDKLGKQKALISDQSCFVGHFIDEDTFKSRNNSYDRKRIEEKGQLFAMHCVMDARGGVIISGVLFDIELL